MYLRKLISWLQELEKEHGDVNVLLQVEPDESYRDRIVTGELTRLWNREEWNIKLFATWDDDQQEVQR